MSWSRLFVAISFVAITSIALGEGNAFCAGPQHFPNLPPGAALPDGAQCAAWVKSSPAAPEVRPENTAANMTTPTPDELATLHSRPLTASPSSTADFARVDGNFTGTTYQILRWSACKWGIDEDVFRAQAWEESKWKQAANGDERTDPNLCHAGAWNGWNGTSCRQSYGILQVKVFDYNTWPEARDSTALNADFRAAEHRRCMNGDINYLRERTPLSPYPNYPTSDTELATWGCIGNWFSGGWYDAGAVDYINHVKQSLAAQPWTQLR
jgi:autotransporter family porin